MEMRVICTVVDSTHHLRRKRARLLSTSRAGHNDADKISLNVKIDTQVNTLAQ